VTQRRARFGSHSALALKEFSRIRKDLHEKITLPKDGHFHNEELRIMKGKQRKYRGLVSSDWNECLAPCGPFDFISFTYPSLASDLAGTFKKYTGNEISLSDATGRIASLLPAPIGEEQMDAYLDACFETYQGVPELMEWCSSNSVLFMINTTGMQGYFQRVFTKGRLPHAPVVSAHPMIRYQEAGIGTCQRYDLLEIQDKPKNTEEVMNAWGVPPGKTILIGDSGGDGPHFDWGAKAGAFLVGSMTKWSLARYCREKEIRINLYLGPRYSQGEKRKEALERDVDFTDLIPKIEQLL
jgi:2-hydroxy-3-keto-5-methylthiopentenyl-1-phosphate phosphatase